MKIIEPTVELITPATALDGIAALKFIERMARISHRSEDAQTPDSWEPFIKAVVLGHGDWSVVEHASATAIFRVDRGATHELVRHRTFSFTQESSRFVNYKKKGGELEFIKPLVLSDGDSYWWSHSCEEAERTYLDLLERHVRPQEARSVLPNALAATIAVTGNLRSWRYLFLARTTKETHPDLGRVVAPLLKTFQERVPLLFDDIEPGARQIDNLRKPR
jgi:thymidylate synthase (FAD)